MNNVMLCYLLTFPDVVDATSVPQEKITGLKDAPYFQPVDISVRSLPGLTLQVETAGVSVTRQRYDERIQVVECHFELPDPLSPAGIQERERIQSSLRNQLIPKEYRDNGLYEEYVVLCLSKIDEAPDAFIKANAGTLAHFIRSQTGNRSTPPRSMKSWSAGCAIRKRT